MPERCDDGVNSGFLQPLWHSSHSVFAGFPKCGLAGREHCEVHPFEVDLTDFPGSEYAVFERLVFSFLLRVFVGSCHDDAASDEGFVFAEGVFVFLGGFRLKRL